MTSSMTTVRAMRNLSTELDQPTQLEAPATRFP
jgi:hypothetical protein